MGNQKALIEDILRLEWKSFQNVKNIGARAACQNDFSTFCIMRSSQAQSWSEETLESYRRDLIEAENAGRNLLSEKYGHMMESTSPAEYAKIAHLLPVIASDAITLIEQIVTIIMQWEVELQKKHPYILAQGRPLFSKEDALGVTSLETYLRGELKSFSIRTLKHYLAHVRKLRQENTNGSEIVMRATVKQYGFHSLQEANDKIKASRSLQGSSMTANHPLRVCRQAAGWRRTEPPNAWINCSARFM
ncbi:MAG: DUF4125 family protein [Desulfatitalea sp.]|nr:DUF4125 family protein [Desulfatitalea sp.]NNK02358.1 DUF4125 family protein [Desulfatitalea sp.]